MYDTSVKVPVIFAQPGSIPQGVVNDDLLSHYDFMPTLLDYLDIPNPDSSKLPGKSFAALLRGEALDDQAPVVVYDEYGPTRMIRTREWKYVHCSPYGPNELYDLCNDPLENHNLLVAAAEDTSADPKATEAVISLKGALDEWFARFADPRLDGTREAVYGKGQLTRAGAAGHGQPAYAVDWWYIDENGNRRE